MDQAGPNPLWVAAVVPCRRVRSRTSIGPTGPVDLYVVRQRLKDAPTYVDSTTMDRVYVRFGEPERADLSMKERREHVHRGAQPSLIGDYRNIAEIAPVLEPKVTVIPQRLKFKAREILPDDIKHSDRPPWPTLLQPWG